MTTADYIAKAVKVFLDNPTASYDQAVDYVVAVVEDRDMAERLVEFVPLAFTRAGFANSGMNFDDRFCRSIGKGKFSRFYPLEAEPIWNIAIAYAQQEINNGLPEKDWLSVVRLSALFDSINKGSQAGAKLQGLVTSPTFFLRSAPLPANATTRWWQIWRE